MIQQFIIEKMKERLKLWLPYGKGEKLSVLCFGCGASAASASQLSALSPREAIREG